MLNVLSVTVVLENDCSCSRMEVVFDRYTSLLFVSLLAGSMDVLQQPSRARQRHRAQAESCPLPVKADWTPIPTVLRGA